MRCYANTHAHVSSINLPAVSGVGNYLNTAGKQAKPLSCWGTIDLICFLKKGEIYRCRPSSPESDISLVPQEGRILSGLSEAWRMGSRLSGGAGPFVNVEHVIKAEKVVTGLFLLKVTQRYPVLWSAGRKCISEQRTETADDTKPSSHFPSFLPAFLLLSLRVATSATLILTPQFHSRNSLFFWVFRLEAFYMFNCVFSCTNYSTTGSFSTLLILNSLDVLDASSIVPVPKPILHP